MRDTLTSVMFEFRPFVIYSNVYRLIGSFKVRAKRASCRIILSTSDHFYSF